MEGCHAHDDEGEWIMVNKPSASEQEGVSSGADDNEEENEGLLKVEFFEPAEYWTQALPLGNGRLGAMVFGGVPCDLLQLNGETSDC